MALPIGLIRKPPPFSGLSASLVRLLHAESDSGLGGQYLLTASCAAEYKESTPEEVIARLLVEPIRLNLLLPLPSGHANICTPHRGPSTPSVWDGENEDDEVDPSSDSSATACRRRDVWSFLMQSSDRGKSALEAAGRRARAALPPREPYILLADSPLEEAFVRRVLTPAALPGIIPHVRPQYEVPRGGRKYRVDYALIGGSRKITIELDGYAYHSDRDAFTADRVRQNELALAGFLILRFTHEMVQGDPGRCVAQLQAAMRLDPVLRGYVDSAPRLEAPQNGGRSC